MNLQKSVLLLLCVFTFSIVNAQNEIPAFKIIKTDKLASYLTDEAKKEFAKSKITEAELAKVLSQKYAERFFYDWNTVDQRFELYNQLYDSKANHYSRGKDQMDKYAAATQWVLPFNYVNGEAVNAYAIRHLARQHKMLDVALLYFYEQKDPKYIRYFVDQMNSLNRALETGKYEKIEDGNGVYEAFRSGYRVLNWITIHNLFLGEKAYTDHDQLVTVATLLQHGANLYHENSKFQAGNHQTRGLSALAMISILLRDFKGTDLWYKRAMDLLAEHMEKEINPDGFQFERSVHYHISDIENYFYVYQLAQISNIEVDKQWKDKLVSLFTTLAKIAYPNKTAPVLQDDTDRPWAEANDISGAMSLGYLLFDDPKVGYFASNKVESFIYWFLPKRQLDALANIKKEKPNYGSLSFPDTHYYIMREGWDKNDKMMIISNGLDAYKPDHQHGDMLGIQAMANGQVILPNYQVNYPIADFQFFKNSIVKNVALVDEELQGKDWTGNQGGSGFGKFKNLPKPSTIAWETNANFDFYVGSHDGFENVGVKYSRQVIYIKNDFWIVKDNFTSNSLHDYKQVWQGHFTHELQPNLLRANFPDASGCDIYQLVNATQATTDGRRGKQWSVVSRTAEKDFSFITAIYPYSGYSNRINELSKQPDLKGWKLNSLSFVAEGNQLRSLSKVNEAYLFNVRKIKIQGLTIDLASETDLFIQMRDKEIILHSIADKEVEISILGSHDTKIEQQAFENSTVLQPGNVIVCKIDGK